MAYHTHRGWTSGRRADRRADLANGGQTNRPTPNIAPNWNATPTDPLPVVRYDRKAVGRSLDEMHWGLVPFWAKDIKVGFANANVKAEGIDSKPTFRKAFQRRCCLVPVRELAFLK
jgi:putative SOS response-associated peptidase YedK